jgi:nucleoside 2-deoxyribosyltransferase
VSRLLYPGGLVYLAGPFFNPTQLALMESVETVLQGAGVPLYSPRLVNGIGVPEGTDPAWTQRSWLTIFQNNCSAIEESCWVLAVLDYAGVTLCTERKTECTACTGIGHIEHIHALQPSCLQQKTYDDKVMVYVPGVYQTCLECRGTGRVPSLGPEVVLPDMGTVWEIGYAYGQGLPIVGYFQKQQDSPMNVMLAHSLWGIVYGLDELQEGLTTGISEVKRGNLQ